MDHVYPGLFDDKYGGMTHIGQIVKDAWVFGLIPETETCKDWTPGRMQVLYDQVSAEWAKYGNLPSRLPPDLAARHTRIHEEAIARARTLGWDPELEDHE